MLTTNSAQNGEARVASKSNISEKTKLYISVFTLSEHETNHTTSTVHAPKM
jgi:hypothetical protein